MTTPRHDWSLDEINALFALPFNDLLFQAHGIYRQNFDVNKVQISSLLSIKTGACPEDCGYCSQSAKHDTTLEREKLMPLDEVLSRALAAKQSGAERFCMGAAWRGPTDKSLDKVIEMIKSVKALGLETCTTLGMLNDKQAESLKDAGLDYYNHNIDTAETFYPQVVTTHTFQDRLDTLESVRNAGIKVCSGGILGLGESENDRAKMLQSLANLREHPESVPINSLVAIKGTPMAEQGKVADIEFVKVIAIARILMPQSVVRLSAGRTEMSESMQAMCFFAGANSIFYGDELLTTANPAESSDQALFKTLGINQPDEINRSVSIKSFNK